jgi:predicted nucleotidyltransferase
MLNENEQTLLAQAGQQLSYPSLFITVSGAHLYGFPSPDSDFDLRGSHILPLEGVVGMDDPEETVTYTFEKAGHEIDLVTHDIKKYLKLLLNKNGYVLEQIYSPLVVQGGPYFEELRALGRGCITRHVYHHYSGFAHSELKRFETEQPRRVKTLLYIYRVLFTGIHLLETRQVEANLVQLNEVFGQPFIPDLIAQKRQEKAVLPETDLPRHQTTISRLFERLETAFRESTLPEAPLNRPALNDFLVRVRLRGQDG